MTDTSVGKVAIIGSGSWGTAISGLVAPHADEVVVWSYDREVADSINACHRNPKQVPFFEIPESVSATTSLELAADGACALLVAVPSAFLRNTLHELSQVLDGSARILVLTKGIEAGTGCLMADVATDELGAGHQIAVLSGRSHTVDLLDRVRAEHGDDPARWLEPFHHQRRQIP